MTVTGIITAIVVGLIIGALGRLVVPGKQNIPIWLTIVVGIVAALLGTAIARGLGVADTRGFDWIELIIQVVLAAIGVVAACWLVIDWRWVLLAYVPAFYFGWFLALLENYFEHHRASNRHSRFADSVSYYGRWYNALMFNEGYHQEHHLKPHLHWTRRPDVRREHLDDFEEAGAYQARMPPILGFFD